MKITVISDTHSWLDDKAFKYLDDADEIWHAGDIGSIEVYDQLNDFTGKLRAVNGNIDGQDIIQVAPDYQAFTIEDKSILITHIAANPPKYNREVRKLIFKYKPDILVCGHSHILKVLHDKWSNLLFINPGACGRHGFHKVRTLIVFEIINSKPQKMNAIELGQRGKIL